MIGKLETNCAHLERITCFGTNIQEEMNQGNISVLQAVESIVRTLQNGADVSLNCMPSIGQELTEIIEDAITHKVVA